MPASFLRRHVRGLLRSRFSPSNSLEGSPEADEDDPPTPSIEQPAFLSQCYLAGIDGRRLDFPEVYCGKTGLDIPSIQLQKLETDVFATYTGPDGGLTQVGEVRRQPMVRMANLDDEMSLSTDGGSDSEESDEEDVDQPISAPLKKDKKNRSNALLGSCSSLIGPNGFHENNIGKGADRFNWSNHNEDKAFGVSLSLYEKNPLTGVNAGDPIADVWGVVGRSNNGVLALADGVNWGEGARLAARCAIRGAIDHFNEHVEKGALHSTTDVFHELLASFHSAHSLILQEGGMLTTLCVGVVAPAKHGNSWVLCVCNVGDSLCFVYNRNYGVREVTLGSHDIDQMRDMRDAGGALGPVDGRNPQLHNLTCSMTFVEEGDIVFITSDGVSDNFDPVVGKFCVIKKTEAENKENSALPTRDDRKLSVVTSDSPSREFARSRACAASLPCVDAARRHELMLVRMRDIISNGIDPPKEGNRLSSPRHEPLFPTVSASLLCHRLIQFATQLSQAKRRTLENPELYKKEKMTKTEQRARLMNVTPAKLELFYRRRAVREKIADMPGKLDHASVVAYKVGRGERAMSTTPDYERRPFVDIRPGAITTNGTEAECSCPTLMEVEPTESVTVTANLENFQRHDHAACSSSVIMRNGDFDRVSLSINMWDEATKQSNSNDRKSHPLSHIVEPNSPVGSARPVSPYEQLPVLSSRDETAPCRRKKHARGSAARHTLGVDVQWLKKLVGKKSDDTVQEPRTPILEQISCEQSISASSREGVSIRRRIRDLLGSNRNLSRTETRNSGCGTSREAINGKTVDRNLNNRPQGLPNGK